MKVLINKDDLYRDFSSDFTDQTWGLQEPSSVGSSILCSALSCPVTREIVVKNQDEGGCLWGGSWAFRIGWSVGGYYDKISFLESPLSDLERLFNRPGSFALILDSFWRHTLFQLASSWTRESLVQRPNCKERFSPAYLTLPNNLSHTARYVP